MSLSSLVRQSHRWLAMTFTAGVIANGVVIMSVYGPKQEQPPAALYLLALVPLGFLLMTGLYLFALPYALKRRADRSATQARG